MMTIHSKLWIFLVKKIALPSVGDWKGVSVFQLEENWQHVYIYHTTRMYATGKYTQRHTHTHRHMIITHTDTHIIITHTYTHTRLNTKFHVVTWHCFKVKHFECVHAYMDTCIHGYTVPLVTCYNFNFNDQFLSNHKLPNYWKSWTNVSSLLLVVRDRLTT